MDQEIAICCQSLTKTFQTGDTWVNALDSLDLKVKKNELLILMGPSGSGKTTLLSIIAGLLKQTSGSCTIFGQEISGFSSEQLLKFRSIELGFIFQSFNLIPSLTAAENVMIPLILQGVRKSEALERAKEVLTTLGLENKCDRLPKELSGGQQQRVSFARGCVHKPRIILCDEPTSFLDGKTGREAVSYLKKLQQETGTTILIVSHDPRITDFADRIVFVEEGKLRE